MKVGYLQKLSSEMSKIQLSNSVSKECNLLPTSGFIQEISGVGKQQQWKAQKPVCDVDSGRPEKLSNYQTLPVYECICKLPKNDFEEGTMLMG